MTVCYHIPHRAVVHTRKSCPRLWIAFERNIVEALSRKPSHTTICDHCQALDRREKRAAKAARDKARRKG